MSPIGPANCHLPKFPVIMDSSSEEELFVIATICADEERRKKNLVRRKHRFWVHNIFKRRPEYGEFHHLFQDLLKDDAKFFLYFRLSQRKFFELLGLLNMPDRQSNFREVISPEERLALTLKFLGHVNSFTTLSFSYRLGYTTVRTIVYETIKIIWDTLSPVVLPKPTIEHWKDIERDFSNLWNFPNCVGALDGKHIAIEKPPKAGPLYFNYKHYHSIVLLALVDANYRFITVDVGAYGRNSDGGIFKSSSLGKLFDKNQLNFPPNKCLPRTKTVLPHVIVADAVFPLTDNLMRPYPEADLKEDEIKKVYNYRHSRARRVVENAFGLLTKKFRWYSTRYNIYPKNVDKIVLATIVLHNFLKNDKCSWQPGELEAEEEYCLLQDIPHVGRRSPFSAEAVREAFSKYFVSPNGIVSFQWDRVFAGRT